MNSLIREQQNAHGVENRQSTKKKARELRALFLGLILVARRSAVSSRSDD
jgi:hypothetical protein